MKTLVVACLCLVGLPVLSQRNHAPVARPTTDSALDRRETEATIVSHAARSTLPIAAGDSAGDSTYVLLLRLRWDLYARWKESGKWPDDSAANAALGGHVRFWDQQRKEGRALLAGGMRGDYWDNVALIVFRAHSDVQANTLVQQDPAVHAHVFQAQVRGFDISWMGQASPKP